MTGGKVVIPVKSVTASCASSCASASTCGSGSSCSDDPEFQLEQQGWVRRTTIGEPRLSEIAENYRAMGYEVHVERWSTGGASCTTCYEAYKEADKSGAGEVWGTVYVRQGRPAAEKDELF